MIRLNCDLGEQPQAVERDRELLELVDAVSIACGGHAGDHDSARFWNRLAEEQGKEVHLHLSYPDRENFGRHPLEIPWQQLADSLSQQREALADCTMVKFHGALYNQAAVDHGLAEQLLAWCVNHDISALLAPPGSAKAVVAEQFDVTVIREGFADRSYQLHEAQLRLTPRKENHALHDSPGKVISQIRSVLENQQMPTDSQHHPFTCDTWCVHSDSDGAVELVRAIRRIWP